MNPTITSNYNGDYVEELMMLAVTSNEIVEGGHIYIEDNIQFKTSITRVRQSNIIQDLAPTPVSQGTQTTDERTITPDPYMVYIEFDPNKYRKIWEKWQPSGEFVFTELSPEVQKQLLELLLTGENGVDNYMGNAILNGNKAVGVAPLNKFDGLITKAKADADVIDVAGFANLTTANIIAKLGDVYNASRVPVRNNKDFKIFMSVTDYEKYTDALIALANKSIDPTQAGPKMFKGKKIVVLTDIPEHTMFATVSNDTRKSNIWLGVRGLVDMSTVKVAQLQANSDLWFFKMKMAADTQIKWGQDFVLYAA